MDPQAVFGAAIRLHQDGQFDEATALYEKLLALFPGHADTLQLRGLIEVQQNRLESALAFFDRALRANPDHAPALTNKSAALIGLERYQEARYSAERAMALGEETVGLYANLATALVKLFHLEEAIAITDRALARDLENAQLHTARADAFAGMGRDAEAAAARARGLVFEPTAANMAKQAAMLVDSNAPLPALALCDRALALDAGCFDALFARARALEALGRFTEAIADCDRALDIDPDSALVFALRGLAFKGARQPERALADFDGALELDPEMDLIPGESVFLSLQSAEWDGLDEKIARLLAAVDAGRYATQPFLLSSLPSSPAQQRKAAARYSLEKGSAIGAPLRPKSFADGKIRMGYFSSDFHEHPVGRLIVGLLEAHDRTQFETFAFAFGGIAQSPTRERIKRACHEFVDVLADTPEEIAALARDKGIHIAVDLNGYTHKSRPKIFTAGAAPVQVNYLGYPSTLGSDAFHYIIGDPLVTPPAHYNDYAERVVTMPGSYLVTTEIRQFVPPRLSTRRELGVPETGFIFSCFNAAFKITPDVFDIWMRLLKAVEGSVLWLNDPGPTAMRNLRREAKERGVASDRLIFAPRTPGDEYLARYRAADLFLDTFYYNAHATGSEALMMGLPVVTRLGQAFAGRVGASLLAAVGLPDLIARDSAEYESIALRLAHDPAALTRVREKLSRDAMTLPLFDTKLYTRHLEAGYREMWRRSMAGLAPDHITIPAA